MLKARINPLSDEPRLEIILVRGQAYACHGLNRQVIARKTAARIAYKSGQKESCISKPLKTNMQHLMCIIHVPTFTDLCLARHNRGIRGPRMYPSQWVLALWLASGSAGDHTRCLSTPLRQINPFVAQWELDR